MTVATDKAARLSDAVGPKRVVTAEEELASYAIGGLSPSAIVRPVSVEEAAEAVRFAVAEKLAVVPVGSKSKCEVGMAPERYDIAIDMTALRDIAHFDPGDLTLSVHAGLPLRELDGFLNEKGQFLPLAVPCFESTTAAGAIASGIDSALRLQYGSPRDFLIGAEFIDGTGKLCKSGGRVVKNVTGYDLHKLLIGSLGTLGVITRVNFRTFPLPAVSGAHLGGFANLQDALEFKSVVEKAGLPLANLELFSPAVSQIIRAILRKSGHAHPQGLGYEGWLVYSAFQGNEQVVQRIERELETSARRSGAAHSAILEKNEDEALGGMLRESFEWLRWASPANVLCRLALPQVKAATVEQLSQLAKSMALRGAVLLRAAGILYFSVFAESENPEALASLTKVVTGARSIAEFEKASSTVLQASAAVKKSVSRPSSSPDAILQQRVKQAFDPSNVFAPGRVVGGI
jgi:glycolate oxidase FAD binding subunit